MSNFSLGSQTKCYENQKNNYRDPNIFPHNSFKKPFVQPNLGDTHQNIEQTSQEKRNYGWSCRPKPQNKSSFNKTKCN